MNTLLSKQPRHGFALHQLYLTLSNGVFGTRSRGYLFSIPLAFYIRCCAFATLSFSTYQIEYHGGWMDPALEMVFVWFANDREGHLTLM
jgi:hypothetical protein